jgi:hypothetical protein
MKVGFMMKKPRFFSKEKMSDPYHGKLLEECEEE